MSKCQARNNSLIKHWNL